MSDLNTSVRLTLRDAFSSEISRSATAAQSFGRNVSGVSSQVNKALSGVAGTFASLGVAIGAGAAINKTIEFEDKLVRLGTVSKSSSAEIKELKNSIFEAASMPDIKVDPDGIVDAMDVIMTKTGNMEFAQANIENIGRAMQGMNASGADIGGMMAEFDKLGYSAEEVTNLMDAMYVQGNMGSFTAAEFAKSGAAVVAAYSSIGTTSKDIEKANAVMQVLAAGTGDPTTAVTVLENVMSELADPSKQAALKKLGISVRDIETGQFRDLTELLPEIVEKGKELGNFDSFGAIFGGTAMEAVKAFNLYGDTLGDLLDLGDTSNALSDAAASNAASLASNLKNLQTLFMSVANEGLEKPLEKITEVLNELSKHPAAIKAVFGALVAGIALVAAAKGVSTILGIVNGIKSLKGGGMPSMPGSGGSSSSSGGTPVFVTNLGGSGFGIGNGQTSNTQSSNTNRSSNTNTRTSTTPNTQTSNISQGGNTNTGTPAGQNQNTSNTETTTGQRTGGTRQRVGSAAKTGALTAAPFALFQMADELNDIKNTEGLTEKEENKAKGGAVGAAVGTIGGTAGGAALGALIGSAVPIVGTILGGLVGGAIGFFGGKLGRFAGEKIGEAVTKEDEALSVEASEEIKSAQNMPTAEQIQQANTQPPLSMDVTVTDETTTVTADYGKSHAVSSHPTGNARMAREMG